VAVLPEYFRSADGCFALRIPGKLLERMLEQCARTGHRETGGILVGRYSEDHRVAEVTAVSGSPSDSSSCRTSFVRGIKGLGRWLRKLWSGHRDYYLGEWHFHPGAMPQPSEVDSSTMFGIAGSEVCKCPEPILFLIGDSVSEGWCFHAEVTTRGGRQVLLRRYGGFRKNDGRASVNRFEGG
jgi:integrative and conjugative element protein (TIGR02256 family)